MSKHDVIDIADTPEGRLHRLRRATRRAGEAPPRLECRYLVKGLLGRGQTSLLFGDSNAGKTTFAVRLACDVASGAPFGDLRTRRGGVLYAAAEAPGSVLMRTEPHRAALGDAAPLDVLGLAVDLGNADDVRTLVDLARERHGDEGHGTALVVIDTLARSIGEADENASGPMTAAVDGAARIARALDAHVMLIHHCGKTPGDARGSSAIRAAVDTALALGTAKTEDGKPCVVVQAVKQRDLPREGRPLAYRILGHAIGEDAEGDVVTTTRLEWLAGEVQAPRPAKGRTSVPSPAGDAPERPRAEAWRDLVRNTLKGVAQAEPGRALTARDLLDRCDPAHELLHGLKEDSRLTAIRRALRALAEDDAEPVREVTGGKGGYIYERGPRNGVASST